MQSYLVKVSQDYLVVNRGSKIIANGTQSKPIRFTHNTAIEGTVGELERSMGWLGYSRSGSNK